MAATAEGTARSWSRQTLVLFRYRALNVTVHFKNVFFNHVFVCGVLSASNCTTPLNCTFDNVTECVNVQLTSYVAPETEITNLHEALITLRAVRFGVNGPGIEERHRFVIV